MFKSQQQKPPTDKLPQDSICVDIMFKNIVHGFFTNNYRLEYILSENIEELVLLFYAPIDCADYVMDVLDILSPERFDELTAKITFITLKTAHNEEKFTDTLNSILNKALTNPTFAVQYVDLCHCLGQQLPALIRKFKWINDPNIYEKEIYMYTAKMFRKMIIMSCEKLFSKQRHQLLQVLPSDVAKESRLQFIGVMVVLGQLFNKGMVHQNIINKGIIKSLLPPENKHILAIHIEGLCKLLTVCGKEMDKTEKTHKVLSQYIKAMKTHSYKFELRIQVMVDELEKLKNNKWHVSHRNEFNNNQNNGNNNYNPQINITQPLSHGNNQFNNNYSKNNNNGNYKRGYNNNRGRGRGRGHGRGRYCKNCAKYGDKCYSHGRYHQNNNYNQNNYNQNNWNSNYQ